MMSKNFSDFAILNINTLATNYEYFHSNRENLALPIQLQLCKKTKNFATILLCFWNLH